MSLLSMEELESNFDDDLAKSILYTSFDRVYDAEETITKSLYNFDLESVEGVTKLLELLPILDPEIMNEVYQEIFPGYPTDNLVARMVRLELRGYLMDYLESQDPKATQEQVEDTDGTAEPEYRKQDEPDAEGSQAG